eukprot:scaffold6572_cov175-Alexandrium_tamarense.AAC.3
MSKPNNNALLINTAITTTFFLAPILYYIHKQKRLNQKQQQYDKERETERAFLYNLTKNPSSQPLRPPLPEIVRNVLVRCRFAYLSTMDVDANSSHLSLMRFTYLPEEEMKASAEGRGGDAKNHLTGEYSITLNGTCSVIKDGPCPSHELLFLPQFTACVPLLVALAEKYRAAHLKNNPDYPQFIVGNDIAMLRVDVAMARICNINDQVIKWNVSEGSS